MVEEKYRTFWPRVGAGFIDPWIVLPLFIVDHFFWREGVPSQLRAAWVTVYSLSGISYSIGMHARFGQTLGKMATKVKVLDLSERKLAFRQALLRDSVPLITILIGLSLDLPKVLAGQNPYAVAKAAEFKPDQGVIIQMLAGSLWGLAEIITMLTNSKRRAIHDLIAHSVVIRLSSPSEGKEVSAA